ncbi:hypothetical protein [uncultured Polaribacter sp.]|uniref:hypothetical protein n=1 Tax=uncultured Polaribacter sp. TaxID=174711 RepID=UPI00260FC0F6|nr:hypothetical protein [uncultured Polaribacter sp.]
MSNTLEAIHLLEDRLKSLLFNYNFLKEENEILLKRNTILQKELLEKEELLAHQTEKMNTLKIAKTIEGSIQNKRETKLKINALIREIDKCIIQLQE